MYFSWGLHRWSSGRREAFNCPSISMPFLIIHRCTERGGLRGIFAIYLRSPVSRCQSSSNNWLIFRVSAFVCPSLILTALCVTPPYYITRLAPIKTFIYNYFFVSSLICTVQKATTLCSVVTSSMSLLLYYFTRIFWNLCSEWITRHRVSMLANDCHWKLEKNCTLYEIMRNPIQCYPKWCTIKLLIFVLEFFV